MSGFDEGNNRAFKGNCYNCGKLGHKSTECRAAKKASGASTGPLATPGGSRGLSLTPTQAHTALETTWQHIHRQVTL